MTDTIYLSLFWLGQYGPIIEKAGATTKDEAIIQAQDLLSGLNLDDTGHRDHLRQMIAGWDGISTLTMATETGSLVLMMMRMGDWTEQPHRHPAG